jgi:SAM-dependent methyltransferase
VLLRHGLTRDSVVVDMGAGTGVLTAAVAPLCRHVIAVDVSPEMTSALRSRFERDGLDNVRVTSCSTSSPPTTNAASKVGSPERSPTRPWDSPPRSWLLTFGPSSAPYSWLFEAILERLGLIILGRDYRRSAYGTYTCARRST